LTRAILVAGRGAPSRERQCVGAAAGSKIECSSAVAARAEIGTAAGVCARLRTWRTASEHVRVRGRVVGGLRRGGHALAHLERMRRGQAR
jgi:hypothetical protein